MRFCPFCGTNNEDEYNFCIKCHQPLPKPDGVEVGPSPPANDAPVDDMELEPVEDGPEVVLEEADEGGAASRREELEMKRVKELRELAKKAGIKNINRLTKSELVDALLEKNLAEEGDEVFSKEWEEWETEEGTPEAPVATSVGQSALSGMTASPVADLRRRLEEGMAQGSVDLVLHDLRAAAKAEGAAAFEPNLLLGDALVWKAERVRERYAQVKQEAAESKEEKARLDEQGRGLERRLAAVEKEAQEAVKKLAQARIQAQKAPQDASLKAQVDLLKEAAKASKAKVVELEQELESTLSKSRELRIARDTMKTRALALRDEAKSLFEEGYAAYTEAWKLDRTSREAASGRLRAAEGIGSKAILAAATKEIMEAQPDNPDLMEAQLEQALKSGQNEEALAILDRLVPLKEGPAKAELLNRKGAILHLMERYEESLECYDRAIEIVPDLEKAVYNRALALEKLDRHEEALEAFTRTVELNASKDKAWMKRGEILERIARAPRKGTDADVLRTRVAEIEAEIAELRAEHAELAELARKVKARTGKGSLDDDVNRLGEAVAAKEAELEKERARLEAAESGKWRTDLLKDALISYERVLALDPKSVKAQYSKGYVLMLLGRMEEALDALDKALAKDASSAKAWYTKGLVLATMERTSDAIGCYDRAIALDANLPEVWYNKGVALDTLGNTQEAMRCYEKATMLDSRDFDAWYNLGVASDLLEKPVQAIKAYQKAVAIRPRDFDAWYNMGVAYDAVAQYQDAVKAYAKALELNPKDAEAWYNRGVDLVELGRLEEALACLEKASVLNPNDPDIWHRKAEALEALNRPHDALECYNRLVRLAPDNARAWYQRAQLLDLLGRSEEASRNRAMAIQLDPKVSSRRTKPKPQTHVAPEAAVAGPLGAISVANPKDPNAWVDKGSELFMSQRYEESVSCYKKALEIRPDDADAWFALGKVYASMGQYKDALAAYDKVLRSPKLAKNESLKEGVWYNRGVALLSLGRLREAVECFDRALELNAGKEEAWYNKGVALKRLGHVKEAIACYDRALAINPKRDKTWYNKGNAFDELGKHKKALECYDKALEINPNAEDAWYNKGAILHAQGDFKGALTCFTKALDINPGYTSAKEARDICLQALKRR